ncbi:MAG TPA: hypothetical protein VL361_01910 [Candidatus Limnocylindrales bacterium]|nr:hypothetical protein [Candidatus Limnocylindrales bacterium]
MKTTILAGLIVAFFGSIFTAPAIEKVSAATDSPPGTPVIIETNPAEPAPVPQWSAEVADVLKLVKAKVDERTIVAFIGHSGRGYNLNAAEIIELKNQGVSDAVLTAMLQQNQRATTAGAGPTPPAVAPQAMSANYGTGQMVYDPNAAAASQPVYVYPESSYYPSYYPYYSSYYYPYWGGYYGYYYPYYCGYYGGHYCYPYYGHGGYCYPYSHYGHGGGYYGHGGGYHGGSYSHGGYHGAYVGYRGTSGYHGGYAGSHTASRPSGFSGGSRGGASFASVSHGGGGHGGGGHGGGHR